MPWRPTQAAVRGFFDGAVPGRRKWMFGMENFFWEGRDDALRGPIEGDNAVVNGTHLAFMASFGSDGKEKCPQASALGHPPPEEPPEGAGGGEEGEGGG